MKSKIHENPKETIKSMSKNLVLGISLLVATTTFAQKDELKTLKKIYDKTQISSEDFSKYKETLVKLESVAATEDDKAASTYYKALSPLVEMAILGKQPILANVQKTFTPDSFESLTDGMLSTLAYENKTGKKVFSPEITQNIKTLSPIFTQMALAFNNANQFKEASKVFYTLYKLNTKDVSNLENAAITALQASDYVVADKLYREIVAIGFKGTGTGKFQSKEVEVAKVLAAIAFETKNYEQAKKEYAIVNQLDTTDISSQVNEATCYYFLNDIATYQTKITAVLAKDPNNAQLQYNVGYLNLSEDSKLVDEINANLKNKAKYDELMNKRKAMFKTALPYFEKAYQLNATNEDTKTILKLTYETLGMKDKAAAIK